LDIIAVILGIFFTIRKLDAFHREPKEFPLVPEAAFLDWQLREVAVYRRASLACFLKIALDWGFLYLFGKLVPFGVLRFVGASIDISWLVVVIYSFVKATALAKERRRLGIILGGFMVSPKEAARRESDEAEEEFDDGFDFDIQEARKKERLREDSEEPN
ncbi:MAG: hypothetical protein MK135_06510, partial [Polyangiaceae bacterium]|nr:hypothetical protein [Polyangiaceae bacterium]